MSAETDAAVGGARRLQQEQRAESIAWTLYKDGIRSVSLRPGVEDTEIVRFLAVLHTSKNITADAADDLLTLLWARGLPVHLATRSASSSTESATPIESDGETIPAAPRRGSHGCGSGRGAAAAGRDRVDGGFRHDPLFPRRPRNRVSAQGERSASTGRTCAATCCPCCSICSSCRPTAPCAPSSIGLIENFIPYLLAAGDFRSVAYMLREIAGRAAAGP